MSHNLTQPEEIDIVLIKLEASDIKTENQAVKNKRIINGQESWNASYIPPYRAAYMGGNANAIEEK